MLSSQIHDPRANCGGRLVAGPVTGQASKLSAAPGDGKIRTGQIHPPSSVVCPLSSDLPNMALLIAAGVVTLAPPPPRRFRGSTIPELAGIKSGTRDYHMAYAQLKRDQNKAAGLTAHGSAPKPNSKYPELVGIKGNTPAYRKKYQQLKRSRFQAAGLTERGTNRKFPKHRTFNIEHPTSNGLEAAAT
ncbi:MAG TPA: hypothetical protein DCQ92_04530 [Verrucomicrobia subdivision 3 bacterium]|nr:hypothetical protein [Limisphaerales bacterium]